MTSTTLQHETGLPAMRNRIGASLGAVYGVLGTTSLVALVSRLGLALPFWRSGANKWDAFAGLDLDPNPLATGIAENGLFSLSPITGK